MYTIKFTKIVYIDCLQKVNKTKVAKLKKNFKFYNVTKLSCKET